MKLLNLGCGDEEYLREGYKIYNLDYVKRKQKNFKIHNLNYFPYPSDDNVFDVIVMDNVLEHLCLYDRDGEHWVNIFGELQRILKPNGILEIRVPHFAGCAYIMEHHNFFSTGDFYIKFNGKLDKWHDGIFYSNKLIVKSIKITFPKFNRLFGKIINMNRTTQEIYEKYLSGIIKAKDIKVSLIKI